MQIPSLIRQLDNSDMKPKAAVERIVVVVWSSEVHSHLPKAELSTLPPGVAEDIPSGHPTWSDELTTDVDVHDCVIVALLFIKYNDPRGYVY